MKRCEKCGSENGQGQVTCQECSSTLTQDEGKKCPFCETYCGPFAKVCSNCGHPLFAQQQEKATVKSMPAVKNNVITFDAKKLKKKKQREARKQQRRPQKIGTTILWGAMAVLFVIGVVSMFF